MSPVEGFGSPVRQRLEPEPEQEGGAGTNTAFVEDDHSSLFGSSPPESPMDVEFGLALPGERDSIAHLPGTHLSSSEVARESSFQDAVIVSSAGSASPESAEQRPTYSEQNFAIPAVSLFNKPGDRATTPLGTKYKAVEGLKLKDGSYAGLSESKKKVYLPKSDPTGGFEVRTGKPRNDKQREGMEALYRNVKSNDKAAAALDIKKGTFLSGKSSYYRNVIDQGKSEAAKLGAQSMTADERRAARRQAAITLGPEGRRAAVEKMKQSISKEERKDARQKQMRTLGTKGRSEATRRGNLNRPFGRGSFNTQDERNPRNDRMQGGPEFVQGSSRDATIQGSSAQPLSTGTGQSDYEVTSRVIALSGNGIDPVLIAEELNLTPDQVEQILRFNQQEEGPY